MSGHPRSTAPAYANAANDLSTALAAVLPKSGEDVSAFLTEAALAMGGRDADLARTLGVSRATFATWKTRGTLPAEPLRWFREHFAAEVLAARHHRGLGGFRHPGLEVALALLWATKFNPFGTGEADDFASAAQVAKHVEGLSRLGLFVLHRVGLEHLPAGEEAVFANVIGIVRPLAVQAGSALRTLSQ